MNHAIQTLQEEIQRLKIENDRLRINHLGVLTRQGAEIENERNTYQGDRYVIALDINYLKELNNQLTQPGADELLRKSFQIRDEDILFRFNVRSGDEYGFVIKGDPDAFIKRLDKSLAENGLSAMMAWEILLSGDDLFTVCDNAMNKVYELKAQRGIKSR